MSSSSPRPWSRQGKLTKYQAQAVYQGKTKGLVFGEYVVLDKLGEGGMGVVLKAQHRRMKRLVAIKVLSSAAMKQPGAVERFHREVEAAAKLSHPNIVTAYDAGEHQGMHYLVMEYVEGKDLAAIVKERGPLAVREAVECILQAARGLQYAHEQGIVHRDIKPGNLLLDKKGTVKILDMGLARIAGAEAALGGPERLTASGQVMGTCDYMAPEQAMDTPRGRRIGPTSIPWAARSTGCLTGQPPYRGETLMQILLAHREAPIPSLCAGPARGARRAGRRLPADGGQEARRTATSRWPRWWPSWRRCSAVLSGQSLGDGGSEAESLQRGLGQDPGVLAGRLRRGARSTRQKKPAAAERTQPSIGPEHDTGTNIFGKAREGGRQGPPQAAGAGGACGRPGLAAGDRPGDHAGNASRRRPRDNNGGGVRKRDGKSGRRRQSSPCRCPVGCPESPRAEYRVLRTQYQAGRSGAERPRASSTCRPSLCPAARARGRGEPQAQACTELRPEPKPEAKPEVKPAPQPAPKVAEKPAEEAGAQAGCCRPAEPEIAAGGKQPVPDEASLKKGLALVREALKDEFAKTKTAAQKLALASVLRQTARQETPDSAQRFAVLQLARDFAAQAGDATAAFAAIDDLAQTFAIDAFTAKSGILAEIVEKARPNNRGQLADAAMELIPRAVEAENFQAAKDLLKTASALVSKLHDRGFTQRLHAAQKDLADSLKSAEAAAAARETLKNRPADPDANLVLGRYQCFLLEQWNDGLKHLAAGADKQLKALSQEELQSGQASWDQSLKLADAWWDLSRKAAGRNREAMIMRAGTWYRHAIEEGLAEGALARARAENRLEEVERVERAQAVPSTHRIQPAR